MEERTSKRRIIQGVVISDKMEKTITVKVDRYPLHAIYKKKVKTTKKYHVHDEQNAAHIGDIVSFMETRPLSATKRFTLVKIIKKAEKVVETNA